MTKWEYSMSYIDFIWLITISCNDFNFKTLCFRHEVQIIILIMNGNTLFMILMFMAILVVNFYINWSSLYRKHILYKHIEQFVIKKSSFSGHGLLILKVGSNELVCLSSSASEKWGFQL